MLGAIVTLFVGMLTIGLVWKGLQRRMEAQAAHDASPGGGDLAASARSVPGDGAEPAPLALVLSALPGDMLHRIASFLIDKDGGDLACFRLACRSFRAHSAPPPRKSRKAFLRSPALVAHAWSDPGFQLGSRVMWRLAVCVGSVDVLDWLRSRLAWVALDRDTGICARAAHEGQLRALQWLRGQHFPWDPATCASAAGAGHLEVLQWAREHECDWDSITCASAAGGGHLDVLRWAREHGCPWDSSTCAYAAGGGHLEVLRWAREHACPWHRATCYSAAAKGHLEVLRWAREQDCEWDALECLRGAQNRGHSDVVAWIHSVTA